MENPSGLNQQATDMANIRYAKLTYTTNNLGDDIQTVATLPFLENTNHAFNRDSLATENCDEKYIILMNAWWAATPENAFPPADCFVPVFIGFHLTQSAIAHFSKPNCVAYLKAHAPIGCRDIATMQILKQWDVPTFFSGCLTTTFQKRESQPTNGKVFLVDTERIDFLIPGYLKKDAVKVTHQYGGDPALRENAVENLLHRYKTEASLIITTRLHAALTCSAMGIPVVFFFHEKDPRATTAEQINLPYYKFFRLKPLLIKKSLIKLGLTFLWTRYEKIFFGIKYTFFGKINWNPAPLDMEEHKINLTRKTTEMIDVVKKYFRLLDEN